MLRVYEDGFACLCSMIVSLSTIGIFCGAEKLGLVYIDGQLGLGMAFVAYVNDTIDIYAFLWWHELV